MQGRRYDRIMAGQNHKSDAIRGANLHGPNQDFRRSHIMILSCHDSVDPPYSSGSLDKGEMSTANCLDHVVFRPGWVTFDQARASRPYASANLEKEND